MNFFFSHMYPTMPIFHRQGLTDLINTHFETSAEVYCLVASLCAFVIVQPGMILPGTPGTDKEARPQKRSSWAKSLLEDIEHVRKSVDYIDRPNVRSVQTSFFLFCVYFSTERRNRCWFHLREASTLAQITNMHEEQSYLGGNTTENIYRRRLYWLILVTERAYAMERHHPLTLHPTIELPRADYDPNDTDIITGFLHLIKLFRLIDDQFIGLWNKSETECSPSWLAELQLQLVEAVPQEMHTTEFQEADIRVTQQWLRTMVWQLSIANGCLSSGTDNVSMTFMYPISIATDLIGYVENLSAESIEVHGVGIIEKLFDVACTLTDVIAYVPLDSLSGTASDPRHYLNRFVDLIANLRGGSSRYVPLLLAKLSESLPDMATPFHQLPATVKHEYQRLVERSSSFSGPSGSQAPPTGSSPMQSFYGTVPPHLAYAEQRGMGTEAYFGPSTHGSDSMSPALGTPPGYPFGPVTAPTIPRSMPTLALQYEAYSG